MKKVIFLIIILGFIIAIASAGGLQSGTLTGMECLCAFSLGCFLCFFGCFVYTKKYSEDEYYEE
ncbi:MAG: hypothetical protein U0M06_02235 [Clostridia bacterium]|nr:hypothetical protein [Clostridia bacterium]